MNEGRKEIFQLLIVAVAAIFLVKLFLIQVMDDRYTEMANSNAIVAETEYPYRGLIYDRNGKLLVSNVPEFNLMIITYEVKKLDSLKFCEVFGLTMPELKQRFRELYTRKEYNKYKPTLFIKQLSNADYARAQDRLDEFPGFNIQARTTRSYTWPSAANALGYVSEASKEELASDKTKVYKQGDYIGKSGLEAFYEPYLSGQRGVRVFMRNVHGMDKGAFGEGKFDTLAVPGKNLVTGLDIELQRYGEKLLAGKAGSIVVRSCATHRKILQQKLSTR
jgi:penicillin-binding protein 2